tara:strand:- start:349 stop:618 length:270 start_codon:yes stop_codon:yes gene_type:complete
MKEETFRIEEYWHDEITTFAAAFGILGERKSPKEDFCESIDFNNLEISCHEILLNSQLLCIKNTPQKNIFFMFVHFPNHIHPIHILSSQ